MENLIKLNVLGITYSQIQSGAYALVLSEESGERRIPIIIGSAEAQSIAVELEHMKPPRPLTHDLLVSILGAFDIKLKSVYIYKFEDGVFSSELLLESKGDESHKIDSRTSDAVAVALRLGADIFTTQEVINKAGVIFDEKNDQSVTVEIDDLDNKQNKIDDLNKRLKDAISREKYEEASHIRDEIQKIVDKNKDNL